MFVHILRYIKGYVRIRITGDSTERFLNLCRNKGIYVRNLAPDQEGYQMEMERKDFLKLKPICKKTHSKVRILQKCGLVFFLHRYRKRKIFLCGGFFAAIFLFAFSGFIWNIHIEGNQKITNEMILSCLDSHKIRSGIRKKGIDCDQIEKEIRQEFETVTWVSSSLEGSRLFIRIREKEDTAVVKKDEQKISDIVAKTDGTIVSIVTRSGVPQVQQGDVVKKGDLLVRGYVEVTDDSQNVIGYQYKYADADIVADTEEMYQDSLDVEYEKKKYTGKKRRIFTLSVNTIRLNIGMEKHHFSKYTVFTKENRLCVGENLYFPVRYGSRKIKEYQLTKATYTKEEVRQILSEHLSSYLSDLKEQQKTVTGHNVSVRIEKKQATAAGTIKIRQDIGRHRGIDIDFQGQDVVE